MAGSPFLQRIEAFLVEANITPTAFGKRALGDPTFVFELRAGRQPRLDTAERVDGFMIQERRKLKRRTKRAA